jgi:hypothetical protein
MDFEQELKQALRRTAPPAGFTDRVMARVQSGRPAPSYRAPARWLTLALAASVMVATFGGLWYREEQQRTQAETAKQQILLAMQITAKQINHVQQKVKRVSYEAN